MTLGRILIVEDDSDIGTVVQDALTEAGYTCRWLTDGAEALRVALAEEFDLVVLDITLPRISGLDICKQVRQQKPTLPIIMLTARNTESDIVAGLESGADDYVSKPCRPRELLARIRARLREQTRRAMAAAAGTTETHAVADEQTLRLGALVLDPDRMRLTKSGTHIELSAREFDFLYLLASHAGRPFSRSVLLQELWDSSLDEYNTNVSVFVSRLRRKIEDNPDEPKYLLTVHSVGYRFAEPSELGE